MRRIEDVIVLDLRFPESVEIAIRIDRDGFFVREVEYRDGVFAYLKILTIDALVGLKAYPKDTVLRAHGVIYRAHLDNHLITVDKDVGDVLFAACIHGAGDELGHLLTATNHINTRGVNLFHKVTATLTNIILYHF